jgi:hypothetical protein
MVTAASSGPRTWSSALTGANSEGASGPGVGSRSRLVHNGCVGTGDGMMMVGTVGIALGVAEMDSGAHELRKTNRIKMKTKKDFFITLISQLDLLDRGLQLFEGSHPGDAFDEFCQ